jgi:urease accessory protein
MSGKIRVAKFGEETRFEHLAYSYPLKLISPRIRCADAAIAYMLGYGGGLVDGDSVAIDADVGDNASLVLLSQGSTKVFKVGNNFEHTSLGASQQLHCRLAQNSSLFLAPEPVTCFRGACFNQSQTFHLTNSSNAVILDWFTCGRLFRGEQWQFQKYSSINNIFIDGEHVIKDSVLLQNDATTVTLEKRQSGYSCYATVFLYGRRLIPLVRKLAGSSQREQLQLQAPPSVLWSVSQLNDVTILRVAAKETEQLKNWLFEWFEPLREDVGPDVYTLLFRSA